MTGVVQVTGELIATRRVGAYQHLTFVAPGVAELARPGQFVALAVGGDTAATLLRRCFSIHKVSPSGTYGGTVDVVVAAHGPGTTWLAGLALHDEVDLVGPLGKAVPAARRSRCRACWSAAATGARRCSGWPSSWPNAAATSRWCSGRRARTGCSGWSRRAGPRTG